MKNKTARMKIIPIISQTASGISLFYHHKKVLQHPIKKGSVSHCPGQTRPFSNAATWNVPVKRRDVNTETDCPHLRGGNNYGCIRLDGCFHPCLLLDGRS